MTEAEEAARRRKRELEEVSEISRDGSSFSATRWQSLATRVGTLESRARLLALLSLFFDFSKRLRRLRFSSQNEFEEDFWHASALQW